MHEYELHLMKNTKFHDHILQHVVIFMNFRVGPSLQAFRAETMVDGLPRAFRFEIFDKKI